MRERINMTKIKVKCENCGKEYFAWECYLKNQKNHFCSQKCVSEFNVGNNNPNFGKHFSDEIRDKIRQKALENYKTGKRIAHNKGKHLSNHTKNLIRQSRLGKKASEETKQKLRENAKNNPNFGIRGKKWSEESKKRASENRKELFKKGKIVVWNKGKKGIYSKERLKEMSEQKKEFWKNPEYREKTISKFKEKRYSDGQKEMYRQITTELWKDPIYREKVCEKLRLENNPAWLGGKSFEPYTFDFNARFKELIKSRDNYTCQLCNNHIEILSPIKRYLVIHHVNYDKKLSIQENCICLCNICHNYTNANRIHWKTFFQSFMAEKYDYKFNENQKIILDFT